MPIAPATTPSPIARNLEVLDPEDEILAYENFHGRADRNAVDHSVITAPVFTRDALDVVGIDVLPQRALYGRVIAQHVPGFPSALKNAKVYVNTNAPFSGLVCGVQVRLILLSLYIFQY